MTTNGLADVYSTEVAADGSLGAWRSELAPASPLFFRGGVANGHFIGGDDPNGMARNVVMHPAFANGRVSAWAPDPSLLQARWRNAAAFTNGFAYAIAGNGGGDPTSDRIATVEYAREGKDGVLQTFQSTTPIPTGAQNIGALAVDDRVVVLGGLSAGGTSSSSVFVAQQAAGGALGPWSATVPLPRPDQLAKLVRKDNHLFLIGGYSGPNVYTATFSGGAVDAWTPALAPSVAVSEVEAIVVGDYLYLLGGAVGSNTVVTDAVQFAPINSGGTLGAWQAARPLPTPRSFVLAVAY